MKIISRIFAIVMFLLFFGFALVNKDEATLRFFLGYQIHAPLVLMLLAFFVAGAVLGILAMSPTLFRHRRELTRHKKTLQTLQGELDAHKIARTQPPQPDAI